MSEKTSRVAGSTIVEPEVLEGLVRLAAENSKGVNRIFSTSSNSGIKIRIDEKKVNVDVYVVMNKRENLVETAKKLQSNIARSVSEIVGMEVGNINVHVEDIEYELK